MLARSFRAPLAAAAIACCALTPAAAADAFSDYRIPTHSAFDWTGNLQGSASRSTQDFAPERLRQDALLGELATKCARWVDGDDGYWSVDAGFDVRGGHQALRRTAFRVSPVEVEDAGEEFRDREARESWSAGVSRGVYTGRIPLAFAGDVRVFGLQTQQWTRSRSTSLATNDVSTVETWNERHDRRRLTQTTALAQVHAGVGRVRDATSVYLVRVLEHRLREGGALARDPSHEARQRLVDLIAVSDGLDDVRSRPARALWGEIARILREDGALAADGFDPADVQRAGESLLEVVSPGRLLNGLPAPVVLRRAGRSAGIFLGARHGRQTSFLESGTRAQTTLDGVPGPVATTAAGQSSAGSRDEVEVGVAGNWHRPVSLRLQLDAQTAMAVPLRPEDDGFRVASTAEATWLLADRWWLSGRVFQSRDVLTDAESAATRFDRWTLSCEADLAYEVEDHTTVRLGLRDIQYNSRAPFGLLPAANAYTRQQDVFLGVTYRFAGRFSAPGFPALSAPVRATPGP